MEWEVGCVRMRGEFVMQQCTDPACAPRLVFSPRGCSRVPGCGVINRLLAEGDGRVDNRGSAMRVEDSRPQRKWLWQVSINAGSGSYEGTNVEALLIVNCSRD